MYRDFSEQSRANLMNLVDQVEREKLCDFTDWIGDRWYDFEDWIGQLDIKYYINNVNIYHQKVLDKNNTSREKIEEIFSAVHGVDHAYGDILNHIYESLKGWEDYTESLCGIIEPAKGKFDSQNMSDILEPFLRDQEKRKMDCLYDQMVQNINGELIFDENLILEYMKKSPAELTDDEQAVLLNVISQLKDTVAIYETLATMGNDQIGADILNYVSWMADSSKYDSFSAVSAHYNEIYVNLLNGISEQSKNENTFAASLVDIGISQSVISILGAETSENLNNLFGKDTLDAYLAKYVSEHSTQYFAKLEVQETDSLKGSGKFKNVNDWLKDKLQDSNLRDETDLPPTYLDKDGNVMNKKDAPSFYEKQLSLAEFKKELQASVSLYQGNFDLEEWGMLNVTVGEAEAHGAISAGLYVIGADGEKKFSPGVDAEIGASVTGVEIEWENQLAGDEMLGINADASATVGEASANANVTAQVFGEDGKLDMQLNAKAEAEAIAVEAEGSIGANILGGEVGVTGGVNVGIGAHAEAGYKDGILKVDIGASVGVGASVSVEVDVGGMIDTVCDTAEAAWDGIQDGWDAFMDWF